MSKIKVDTIGVLDDSSSVTTATLTGLPARMAAAETNKANKGANSDITSLSALTTALSIAQGGTGGITPDAARAALGVVGRNRIINGDCAIAQRGSGTFTANYGHGFGGPDRMKGVNSTTTGQFTQSQSAFTEGGVSRLCVQQTVNTAIGATTGLNYWGGIGQYIEGVNCYDLVGQPVSISFAFISNISGTFSVSLRDSVGTSYVTSFTAVAGTAKRVAISTPAVPAGATIPNSSAMGMVVQIGALNTGTYQAPSINTWLPSVYVAAPGATNWGATPGNWIAMSELQLEAGAAPTPFERLSYTDRLGLCQRYYYRLTASVPVGMGHFRGSATVASFMWKHPVTMRASPSAAASSGAAFNIYTSNGAPLSSTFTPVTSAFDTIWADLTTSVAATSGWPAMLVVSAGNYVECNAEL